jgi:hypothetical protein
MTSDSNKYLAGASLLGYLFQCRLALLTGIQLSKTFPGLSLSIEKFDDVSFECGDKPALLMQLKHHVAPGNLTDHSPDLWKTLRIWCEQVKSNPQLPFETRFTILTTATASEGSAASKLRPGRSEDDLKAALQQLELVAVSSKNESTKDARASLMDLQHQERMSLDSMLVFDNAPNITDVRAEIEDLLIFAVPAQHLCKLVDHLEGWWFAAVIRSLMDTAEPSLTLLALRTKIDELATAFKQGELLLNPAIEASLDAASLAADDLTFVKQMNCVGIGQSAMNAAKRDFYRATTQRSEWVRENVLLDGEAQRYDEALIDRWERECEAQTDGADLSSDEKKQAHGRIIFHWASRYQAPFRNRHEAWLTTGSYHVLADNIRVGWHPDFRTLFGTNEGY